MCTALTRFNIFFSIMFQQVTEDLDDEDGVYIRYCTDGSATYSIWGACRSTREPSGGEGLWGAYSPPRHAAGSPKKKSDMPSRAPVVHVAFRYQRTTDHHLLMRIKFGHRTIPYSSVIEVSFPPIHEAFRLPSSTCTSLCKFYFEVIDR